MHDGVNPAPFWAGRQQRVRQARPPDTQPASDTHPLPLQGRRLARMRRSVDTGWILSAKPWPVRLCLCLECQIRSIQASTTHPAARVKQASKPPRADRVNSLEGQKVGATPRASSSIERISPAGGVVVRALFPAAPGRPSSGLDNQTACCWNICMRGRAFRSIDPSIDRSADVLIHLTPLPL